MRANRRSVDIEWGDCDPAGIVFYPRYFAWFDACTAHLFAAAGLPKPELLRRFNVVGFPMVDTQATFHVPSRFGDRVEIETEIVRLGGSSFEIEHRLLRGEVLAVRGHEKRVLVRRAEEGEGIRPCPIPDEVRRLFQ